MLLELACYESVTDLQCVHSDYVFISVVFNRIYQGFDESLARDCLEIGVISFKCSVVTHKSDALFLSSELVEDALRIVR